MTNYDILKEYEAHKIPVPSYMEWQAKDSQIDCLQQKVSVLESENQQLKDLLKECREKFVEAENNYGFDDSIVDICDPIIKKIDEVLK